MHHIVLNELQEQIRIKIETLSLLDGYKLSDEILTYLSVNKNRFPISTLIILTEIRQGLAQIFPDKITDVPKQIRSSLLCDILSHSEVQLLVKLVVSYKLLSLIRGN